MAPRTLELLAPARDAATAITAIDHGADAVYIGPPSHGARAAASNTIEDIARVCEYAHRFRARVYATVNTLIYDDELEGVERLIGELWRAGVDALIVQDMAVLKLDIPPIALHASTQCNAVTPERAAMLAAAGFSQIVVPRELTLDEMRRFAEVTPVPLEGFVHGALCVSYSGDCRASLVNGGRSANRGACAQICRLPYDLVDGNGNVVVANRHLLSLKDLNRLTDLRAMADAGISSFKIEGRLKGEDYVKNVVLAYSRALDRICADAPDLYRRASAGRVVGNFVPNLDKAFNRGFTSYFLHEKPAEKMSSQLTPKWIGVPVGKVVKATPRRVEVKTTVQINNGDGLGYFDSRGAFTGFRVNRAEGGIIMPATPVDVRPGMMLYRNTDKAFDDLMAADDTRRRIGLEMKLSARNGMIILQVCDERGCRIQTAIECETQEARTPQKSEHQRVLGRLGDTIYTLDSLEDEIEGVFVRSSELTALRRRAIETLDHAAASTRPLDLRRQSTEFSTPEKVDFHENIANRLAEEFYREHGTREMVRTMEVNAPEASQELHVMTTRYCLRRELGACLKTPEGKKLPSPLFLRSVNPSALTRGDIRLDFDCARCQMRVVSLPKR